MARPKRTVAAATTGGTREVTKPVSMGVSVSPSEARPKKALAEALAWERAREAMRPAGGLRAKQPVKLSDGQVVRMRAKEEELGEVEDGVEQGEDEGARFGMKVCNCEQPVEGVGSSSANDLHRTDGELAPPAGNQNFVSDDEAHALRNCATLQNVGKHEIAADAEFTCTACGHRVGLEEVRAHPVLHVGVCDDCYEFLFSSPFTKDNPLDPSEHENECRWCGDGGEVVLCDTCPKAFCKSCIKRNFGAVILGGIESPTRQWQCFVCDGDLLQALILEYKNIGMAAKTMNRKGQARKPRKSRVFQRQRRGKRTTFPGDTIADIIAREKELLQSEYPDMNFTGFEVKRRRRSDSLLAEGNLMYSNTPEHGTSLSFGPIPEVHLL